MTTITESLATLRARLARAALAAGRPATSVTIVAVSKTHPLEAIRAAHDAGLGHFGENYLQEAVAKITQWRDGVTWHYIGGIQANKTRAIATHFDWVQTVASPRIAERLAAQRPYYAAPLEVCLQVAPHEGVAGRSGAGADEVPALATAVAGLSRLRLRGLMYMPMPGLDTVALRAGFRRVRGLFEALRAAGHDLDTLSMGMSEDLEIAVEEGSTMVRVGTALFGARVAHGE